MVRQGGGGCGSKGLKSIALETQSNNLSRLILDKQFSHSLYKRDFNDHGLTIKLRLNEKPGIF